MSGETHVLNMENKEHKLKSGTSSDWSIRSPVSARSRSRSSSPPPGLGEDIFHKYLDIIHSKTNISPEEKQLEPPDRPFDFFDDEEFAFGINLLNNNVACVGDNMTKLIQMSQEPWPDNVKLFQPYEVEQILLPDNASCLAVQAFLKMCNLPFEVEMRWNAEFMSPSGRVPFIKCGAFVVSELEPIVQFAANKGVTLCSRLSTEEKAEMRAYMSLITNVLVNAELYVSWLDNETFNAVTKVRNSSVYPWPLGWLQTRSKRNAVAKRLKALHWHDKTLEQVLADVEQCCNSLSQRLGDRDYFFGSSPCPLDALLYGHIRALLSAVGPKVALLIKPITSTLLKHVVRVAGDTRMRLKPQEEYLIAQAFQVQMTRSPERSLSSERSARVRKSRLSLWNASKQNLSYRSKDLGFKPFASKQMIIMPSKDGGLSCKPNKKHNLALYSEENLIFVMDIIEDIIDKVDELAFEIPDKVTKLDSSKKSDFARQSDFEIVYPKDVTQIIVKLNECLGTIEESNTSKSRIDDENPSESRIDDEQSNAIDDEKPNQLDDEQLNPIDDEKLNLIDSENRSNRLDSDGVVNDKLLDEKRVSNSDFTDSSNKNKWDGLAVISSGDAKSDKSEIPKTPVSSGSKSTLKLASDEISVESLLKHLCEANASFGTKLEMPTELDALVFGHVFTIITTRLPCRQLAEVVRSHDTLVALAKRVDEQYFKRA